MRPEFDLEHAIIETQARHLDILELPLSRQVFWLVSGATFLLAGIFFSRVLFLSVLKGSFYRNRSTMNVAYPVTLPAVRGLIYDRNGEIIARNESAYRLVFNAGLAKKQSLDIGTALNSLSGILETDKEILLSIIKKADFENMALVTLASNISPFQVAEIQELRIPFLEIQDDYRREYADGPAFAHVVGYTGLIQLGDLRGKVGLEDYYNSVLAGKDGLRLLYKNAKGEILDEKYFNAPQNGKDIYLTIDAGLQRYFYERLRQMLAFLGRDIGVGIALNPKNGEVLALVNVPSFDNNVFTLPMAKVERVSLLTDSLKPLLDRAVSGVYTPGSTVKPIVALAGLKEGIITPQSRVFSSGVLNIPNPYDPEHPSKFLDWKAHGWVDVRSALARSSNIFFYAVGGGLPASVADISDFRKGLGIGKLKNYWKFFGFGKKTGIDLNGEKDGFLPDPEEKEVRKKDIWRLGDTYNVSIGQGDLMVTPIQLVSQIAAIANDGRWYKPHFLKEVKGGGKVQPELTRDFSNFFEELKEIKEGMKDTVRKPYGTAYLLADLPMQVAGKTGSSQVANNTKTNAFFVAYAPADNPQIAILVLIENAREGSLNAVPVGKDVLDWYYWNRIAKQESGAIF